MAFSRLFISKNTNMKSISEKINDMKTLEELDALQNELNEKFEVRRRVLNLVSEARELGGKSFGYLKESFENLSPKLFKTNEGKAVMKKYAAVMKENKSLSSLHKLYENIRKEFRKLRNWLKKRVCRLVFARKTTPLKIKR